MLVQYHIQNSELRLYYPLTKNLIIIHPDYCSAWHFYDVDPSLPYCQMPPDSNSIEISKNLFSELYWNIRVYNEKLRSSPHIQFEPDILDIIERVKTLENKLFERLESLQIQI